MKTHIFFTLVIASAAGLCAQTDPGVSGIAFSGFLKTDMMVDTRQTASLREGHFLVFPAAPQKANGEDINASASFNILSIQTRLAGKITGPDAFRAKSSGLLEGEFFGTADGDANGFRLRHAWLKLDWPGTSLLVGQMWHPMFVTEMFPGVVSFNTGVPFQPFSRNPQLRLTQTVAGMKIIAAAMSQRDFQSYGPAASNSTTSSPSVQSSSYLRNAMMPDLHLQFQLPFFSHLFGVGGGYKIIQPRQADAGGKTAEKLGGASALGYGKLGLGPVTLKMEGVWGQNLADMVMLGGYAAKAADTNAYTPLGCYSVWGEISYGKDVELAMFGGYSRNLGAGENVAGVYYARGNNIDFLYRVSPRLQVTSGKVKFSAEVELTAAAYGTNDNTDKGTVKNAKSVTNTRVLLATFYFF